MMRDIGYTSDNGYTGYLFGKSSMSILNSKGEEVMHTGSRNINTEEELIETVEHFPEFLEIMFGDKGGKNDKI